MLNCILDMFPSIQTNGPIVVWIPLIFTVILGIMREGLSDYKRWSEDRKTNNKKVSVYVDGKWQKKVWKDVRHGQLVLIKEKEYFPADLFLVASSDATG
jgi:phospholipid-transporting ATPase